MDRAAQAVAELNHIFDILSADVHRANNAVRERGEAAAKRELVRAIFAFVEGMTYRMKQLAHDTILDRALSVREGTLLLLCDSQPIVTEQGEVELRPAKVRLKASIRLAFKSVAYSFDVDHTVSIDVAGWAALSRAQLVRNRLMHPKRSGDLAIRADELVDARLTHDWFKGECVTILQKIQAKASEWLAALPSVEDAPQEAV
jgi:hypothetical protein